MIKKFISLSSFGIMLITPTMGLTSCGQLSQFVPAVKMTINSEQYYVGYGSNNVIYSATDKKELDSKKTSTKDLLKFYLTGILPFLTISDRLINLSHYSEDKTNHNLVYTKNIVFNESDTWNANDNKPNALFEEFMYASSNILNQGRTNQIKLNLSELKINGLTNSYLPYSSDEATNKSKKIIIDKLEKPIELKENQKIYVYDSSETGYKLAENQQGVYYTNQGYLSSDQTNPLPKFNLDLIYRYYYPENQDKFKLPIDNIQPIKDYVKNNNAWNGFVPSRTEFTLKVNVEITLRPKFEFVPYIIKTGDTLPTADEAKKLVQLTENTSQNGYEAQLDFDKEGNSEKFSNWLYEPKFLPLNGVTISESTTPLLFELNKSKDTTGINDFTNSKVLNDALGRITSTPSINTVEDYNKFVIKVKEFKNFLTISGTNNK